MFETTRPDDYLLRLAASDLGLGYKALVLDELRIEPGHIVLDLGCGPGADLPAYADAVGPHGRVLGVDHDPRLIEQARLRTRDLGQVRVAEADVHSLDLAEGSVDRVHTDRVLQHVVDPAGAIREARRALRAGGRATFAEPDWDTLIIDVPDPNLARAYRRFVVDRVVRNAIIGRQLVRLAENAGFTVETVVPVTATFRDATSADEVLGFHRVTARAVAANYLTDRDAERWLQDLASGPFFASATLFVVSATR